MVWYKIIFPTRKMRYKYGAKNFLTMYITCCEKTINKNQKKNNIACFTLHRVKHKYLNFLYLETAE